MRLAANKIEDQVTDRWKTTDSTTSNRSVTAGSYRPGDEVVVLDDVTPLSAGWMSTLAEHDLRLIEALLAVLEAKQTDNSIKKISAQIVDELDWE